VRECGALREKRGERERRGGTQRRTLLVLRSEVCGGRWRISPNAHRNSEVFRWCEAFAFSRRFRCFVRRLVHTTPPDPPSIELSIHRDTSRDLYSPLSSVYSLSHPRPLRLHYRSTNRRSQFSRAFSFSLSLFASFERAYRLGQHLSPHNPPLCVAVRLFSPPYVATTPYVHLVHLVHRHIHTSSAPRNNARRAPLAQGRQGAPTSTLTRSLSRFVCSPQSSCFVPVGASWRRVGRQILAGTSTPCCCFSGSFPRSVAHRSSVLPPSRRPRDLYRTSSSTSARTQSEVRRRRRRRRHDA